MAFTLAARNNQLPSLYQGPEALDRKYNADDEPTGSRGNTDGDTEAVRIHIKSKKPTSTLQPASAASSSTTTTSAAAVRGPSSHSCRPAHLIYFGGLCLVGYASSLYALATHYHGEGLLPPGPCVGLALSTAGLVAATAHLVEQLR